MTAAIRTVITISMSLNLSVLFMLLLQSSKYWEVSFRYSRAKSVHSFQQSEASPFYFHWSLLYASKAH